MQLKRFNMASVASDSVIIFLGKRNTGKSFLLRDLLFYHQDLPAGVVICPTDGPTSFYTNFVPPLFIHEEFSEEIVASFLRRQKKITQAACKQKRSGGGGGSSSNSDIAESGASNKVIDPRAFLLMDDCLYDDTWTRTKAIRSVFMNGRHTNIMFMATMQTPLGIPPNLRGNIDYTFILRNNNETDRKKIYVNYASVFKTFDIFCQVMDQMTANFGCLVIHNASRSSKFEDQVFWYKADEHPDFTLGAEAYWQYSKQYCREESDDEEGEDNNADTLLYGSRKRPVVKVRKVDCT